MVVDSSVAVKWLVTETLSEEAAALLAPEFTLIAPELMFIEAANALWAMWRRGFVDAADVRGGLEVLMLAPVTIQGGGHGLLPAAARLAVDLSHPIYDCIYLALAMQADAPVITADERLVGVVSRHPYLSQLVRRLGAPNP